jgi:hypothetical protein
MNVSAGFFLKANKLPTIGNDGIKNTFGIFFLESTRYKPQTIKQVAITNNNHHLLAIYIAKSGKIINGDVAMAAKFTNTIYSRNHFGNHVPSPNSKFKSMEFLNLVKEMIQV